MDKRLGVSLAAALAAFLLTAPVASAAWEVGDRCVANAVEPNSTAIMLNNDEPYLALAPVVPPEGGRVITRWRVQTGPGQAPTAQRLVVLQQVGEEEDRKVGESALETVGLGVSEFATRIPAPEYAHVGLTGPDGALLCEKTEMHLAGAVEDAWPVGETRKFKVLSNVGVPVIAVAEADVDGDGYGDETQDRCPASAAHQGDCPTVTPSVLSRVVRRNAILVRAQVDSDASVEATGSIRWLKAPPGDRRRKTYSRVTPVTVRLSAGLSRQLTAGAPATFRVPLPKAVLRRLAKLNPKRALRARITVTATDLAVRETTRTVVVRLRGRDRDA
ncbi:MAG TPA: hypothetical protein VHF50_06515 [Solirubrobacterales bacterium]|nr:hypothetical protein [Solirubrobacterales bacterium]